MKQNRKKKIIDSMRINPYILQQNKTLASSLFLQAENTYKYLRLQHLKNKRNKKRQNSIENQIKTRNVIQYYLKSILHSSLFNAKRYIPLKWNTKLHTVLQTNINKYKLDSLKVKALKFKVNAYNRLKTKLNIIKKKAMKNDFYVDEAVFTSFYNLINTQNIQLKKRKTTTLTSKTNYIQTSKHNQKAILLSNNNKLYVSLLKSKIYTLGQHKKQYNFYLRAMSLVKMV